MMSVEGCARKNPLTPPLMNIEMKPRANRDARVDAQLGAVKAAQPHQHDDRGWNRDHQGREREYQRRNRVHPADEHVMPVNHVAEDSQGAHASKPALGG